MFHYYFNLKTFQENSTSEPFGVFLAWHIWIHRKTTPGRAIKRFGGVERSPSTFCWRSSSIGQCLCGCIAGIMCMLVSAQVPNEFRHMILGTLRSRWLRQTISTRIKSVLESTFSTCCGKSLLSSRKRKAVARFSALEATFGEH
jgi:hypothetical protein